MSKPNSTLNQERLIELLDYNPESGEFTWRKNMGTRVKKGDPAGSMVSWGYRRIGIDGKAYRAHRLAFLYVYGFLPAFIDHIDGNRINNRINNLRETTLALNNENIRRAPKSNLSTGVLGVTLSKKGFQAVIRVNKKGIYLGLYKTAEDAHQAYLEAKRRLHRGCTI